MNQLLSVLRSLAARRLTIALMGVAAAAMAVITVFEALEATGDTPYRLYGSWWFTALLWLVWVNLACNAAMRSWWRWKKLPGALAHLGFLLILTGGYLTGALGIRGNLFIEEGSRRDAFALRDPVLRAAMMTEGGRAEFAFPLATGGTFRSRDILDALNPFGPARRVELEGGPSIVILETSESSSVRTDLVADPSGRGRPGASLDMHSDRSRTVLLQEGDLVAIGESAMSRIAFRHCPADEDTAPHLDAVFAQSLEIRPPQGEPVSMLLSLPEDAGREIVKNSWTIKILEYHPDFKMGRPPNPADPPHNPALRLEVNGPDGSATLFTFADFPDFHGNRMEDGTAVYLRMPAKGTTLLLLARGGDDLEAYTSRTEAPALLAKGKPLELGEGPEAVRLSLRDVLPSSMIEETVVPVSGDGGPPAYSVRVGEDGKPAWLSSQGGLALSADGKTMTIVGEAYPLGFSVFLKDAVAKWWPASGIPRVYYSDVEVEFDSETAQQGSETAQAMRIETNHPILVNGFRLYQSDMDQQPPHTWSGFSVSKDPGIPLVTIGFLLMSLGLLWLYTVRFIIRPAGKGARAAPPAVAAAVLAALFVAPPAGAQEIPEPPDVSGMQDLVVLTRGRMKPLATHARETLIRCFGTARLDGMTPLETMASALFRPEAWLERKCLTPGAELSRMVFDGRPSLSLREVFDAHESLTAIEEMWRQAAADHAGSASVDAERIRSITRLRDEARILFNEASTIDAGLFDLRFLPDPDSTEGDWLNLTEARRAIDRGDDVIVASEDVLEAGVAAFDGLAESYRAGDGAAFERYLAALKKAQRAITADPAVRNPILSSGLVRLELLYYAVDFRIVGLALFGLCSLLYAVGAIYKSRLSMQAAFAVLLLGTAWNCWIIGGHTAIAGRLPLKNLQEVYLVVLFFLPVIGLLLRFLLRSPLYGGLSAGLAVVGFSGSIFLPPEGYMIEPLVAILHSPWRQVHILTIMLSYAILLVACGLHVAYLAERIFGDEETDAGPTDLAQDLDAKAYHLVAWGFLFLTIGIATGAAWGHSAWGRYWGWDPKEVWATVAWAIYALFLHARLFFRVNREVLAAINIIGYAAILFTYFGVTYLLPGLHAYR